MAQTRRRPAKRTPSRGTSGTRAARPKTIDADIDLQVVVRETPERVFDALATAEGLDAWFTTGTTLDPRPGGKMVWRWKDWALSTGETSARAEVLESRRPERFAFRWEAADNMWTTVRMDFEAHPVGTSVRLRETGFPHTPRGRRVLVRTAGGWGEALALAKLYVEHGVRY